MASRIRAIFNAPDRDEAQRLLNQAIESWRKDAPKLAVWAEENLPQGFAVFDYLPSYRTRLSLCYDTPDQVYHTASGGGARIVDKYCEKLLSWHPSEKEKTHSEIETKKETENLGSAVPLHVKGYPLKLDALLS